MTYNYFLQVPAYPKEPATKKVFVAWLEQCFKVGCLDKTPALTSLIKSNCAKALLVGKCLELHKQMLNVVKDQSTTEHVASNKDGSGDDDNEDDDNEDSECRLFLDVC